jgi:heme oxygenase
MADLRAATWPCHQRLEKRIDVGSRFADRDRYCAHLARMWGFCAALEERLLPATVEASLPDYEQRRKAPLLLRDLSALGFSPAAAAALPRCQRVPDCADLASALGCLYVFEGASLGGRAMLPMIEKRLGLTAAHGAAFMASYGSDVDRMWRVFGQALEAGCDAAPLRARAVVGAVHTFEALGDWLCA